MNWFWRSLRMIRIEASLTADSRRLARGVHGRIERHFDGFVLRQRTLNPVYSGELTDIFVFFSEKLGVLSLAILIQSTLIIASLSADE